MSEEILKALMHLFAIIAKQDGGVEENEKEYVRTFLLQQLSDAVVDEYYGLFEKHAGLADEENGEAKKEKLTSVLDSVRILSICRKINKTLTQNQKAVVLVRLYELVNADQKFTSQRMGIINTVADVFKIPKEETASIEEFFLSLDPSTITNPDVMVVGGYIYILHVPSVDLYFIRYTGSEELFLNGLAISPGRIYLFANGSTIRLPKGKPLYYSDIAAAFRHEKTSGRLSCEVDRVNYFFDSGHQGLHEISFAEYHGGLIGIMGASGAGKTTLLNVLSGLATPSSGSVVINGIDLYREPEKLSGVIGLIPQDDLLIEELTVYENLYYNAKLCFKDKQDEELAALVNKTLASLGLFEIKDYKVGSVLNKLISGGQRKRLNIALELIREPAILFVDEPTSGLSSRDSENVMDLLRELTLKGKLIFVVIHQPSSDIYKMFDKIILLDTGGYLIYYGNPVEAIMYFKRLDAQINSDVGECAVCGTVNPELLFNIVDAKVVDEFGQYTDERKVSPGHWAELFRENYPVQKKEPVTDPPPRNLSVPPWLKQVAIFATRDIRSKLSNRQYLLLTLLEAPVLGFILSYIIRYIADPRSNTYIFRENENIPVYIFMSLIVALFLGMIVSAEEIFKDSKILKREAFLNLSRSGYLVSKIAILFIISALQAILFIMVGNSILGIKGMYATYWLAYFSTALCANMIGLNISAGLNSAVTIYIVIPLLIIPMMVLSGAMFPYDKLNRSIGSVDKVPWIAEIMPTKWSYEALMVHQFKENEYEKPFYELRKQESMADFRQVYLIPELRERLQLVREEFAGKGKVEQTAPDLLLLKNEIEKEQVMAPEIPFEGWEQLVPEKVSEDLLSRTSAYLNRLHKHYSEVFMQANTHEQLLIHHLAEKDASLYQWVKDNYYNESVAEHVRKVFEKHKMVEYRNELVQQYEPIYKDPHPDGWLGFRAHFFSPRKYFAGTYFDTYWFNMGVIWFLIILLYCTLYYDLLRKFVRWLEKIKYRKPKNFG